MFFTVLVLLVWLVVAAIAGELIRVRDARKRLDVHQGRARSAGNPAVFEGHCDRA